MRSVFFLLVISFNALAQPKKQFIEILVTPNSPDWEYKIDEQADFNVSVLKNGQPISNSTITYELGQDMMETEKEGKLVLKDGTGVIKGMKMNKPGFLRCFVTSRIEGKEYRTWATAAFEPDKIEPFTKMPTDFDDFWQSAKEELAKQPLDAIVTLVPELCTSEINVYHVNLQNIKMPHSWRGSSRFYGMLSVPRNKAKFPAILAVPGAGVRPYGRDDRAARGVIVFKVGIHGIPVNREAEYYESLGKGALSGYQHYNMHDRDEYYYKRVFMGCIRAIDFIESLPGYNGEDLAVNGGSQGGALSIILAGMDKRVDYLAAFYPAMSDMMGYLGGQAGGWPHMFKNYDEKQNPGWVNVAPYYDVVNFARKLTVPGWYSWGFNDTVCPPTSTYAAYNVINAPKELHVFQETEHWTYPIQREMADKWLFKMLGVSEK